MKLNSGYLRNFLAVKKYTLEYCGTKVKSEDITDLKSKDEETKSDYVYNGIKIDGNFSDWNVVDKKDVTVTLRKTITYQRLRLYLTGIIFTYILRKLQMVQL